jgi:hypothetical protein
MDEFAAVWARITAHAGETFQLIRAGSFTYSMDGNSVITDRTNRALGRSQFEKAYARRPIANTADLHDLQGPSYLYAILADRRIAGG